MEDIIIGLCTLLCSGENFTDMKAFGELREEWSRKLLELPHGIPDSDTFRRTFERINPKPLAECLYDWLGCHWEKETVVAIDGKTVCGSKNKSHKAYHVASGFAAENQLVLGELLTTDLSWLPERSDWAGLEAVVLWCSTVTKNGTTSINTRFFITSLTDINRFSYAVRKHWVIENQLHWSLDVIFDEQSSRTRKDLSPLNLNVLCKTALALCKHADFGRKVSVQKKRFADALDPNRFQYPFC